MSLTADFPPAPSATPAPSTPPAPPARDRSTGLVVMGVIQILMGAVSAFMMLFAFVGMALASRMQRPGAPDLGLRQMLPGLLVYGGAAVFFVWTGIGAIRARRWARSLMLVVSSLWLITGVVSMPLLAVLTSRMTDTMGAQMAHQNARAAQGMDAIAGIIIGAVMFLMFLLMVVLPSVFVLFYRSPHVRATCERRDPSISWTERVPLPVLALVVMLAYGAVMFLVMSYTFNHVALFGFVLSGVAGAAGNVALAALWAVLAWQVYKLRPAGLWGTLAASVILTISHVDTVWGLTIIDYYRKIGMPEATIALSEPYADMYGRYGLALVGVWVIPFVGYLVWLRRYFKSVN